MSDHLCILHVEGGRLATAPWSNGEGGTYTDRTDHAELESSNLPDGYYRATIDLDETDCLLTDLTAIPIPIVRLPHGQPGVLVLQIDNEQVQVTIPGTNPGAVANLRPQDNRVSLGYLDGRVVWLINGGKEHWVTRNPVRVPQPRATAAEQGVLQRVHQGGAHFVNPFTFVPLPPTVVRSAPTGHEAMKPGHVSGWFDWTLDLVSPVLLPADTYKPDGPLVEDAVVRLPGSSLRGALRSIHEVLAGGCLRILDTDYLPVHREPMNAFTGNERLVVVDELDRDGRVATVRVAHEVVWVNVEVLLQSFTADQLYSGMQFNLSLAGAETRHNRREQSTPGSATAGTDWVMLITDGGARHRHPSYFVAAGRIDDESPTLEVTDPAWQRYLSACAGSNGQLNQEGQPPVTSHFPPGSDAWPHQMVVYDGIRVGRSRKSDGWLAVGDTLWVTREGDLKMSAIWRRHGKRPVNDRLPNDSLKPCHDPADLCPTCAVFGSIDPTQGRDDQKGYGSHLRVGFGSTNPTSTTRVDLPPLRSPKPTSGGLYLQHPANLTDDRRTAATDLPVAQRGSHITRSHWGSTLDTPNPRPIAGRKYYWHGQDATDPNGRHTPRKTTPEHQGHAQALPVGTLITARVWFDNLSPKQLGLLLAAAAPGRVLSGPDTDYAIHVGGGKPLGFGTVRATVPNLQAQSATSRYTRSDADTPLTVDELLDQARQVGTDARLASCWHGLRHALKIGFVPTDRIWYPTTGNFLARTPANQEEFDKAFAWFATHSGGRTGALVTLPTVDQFNQYLPAAQE